VSAQDWPARPITIVCRSAPAARPISWPASFATHMQPKFGQNVVVENRAGAGGSIGTGYVAKARRTATRCCSAPSARSRQCRALSQADVDVDKDLQPVTQLVSFPNLLIVNPKLPIKNVQELIDYVKKNEAR